MPGKVLSGAFGNTDPGRFNSYGASGDSYFAGGHGTGSFQLFSSALVVTSASLHALADFGTDGNCEFRWLAGSNEVSRFWLVLIVDLLEFLNHLSLYFIPLTLTIQFILS
ncbi:hypothetical protein PM082_022165 [Marasmius tenuissimus]|nr:hypothetical protein PM082_022165 [Marasmius tenuissimus]